MMRLATRKLVAAAVVFAFIKLPKVMQESPKGGYLSLLRNKLMLMGALGIFVYVGAEVAIGSFLVNYFSDMNLAVIVMENEMMMNIANTIASVFNKTFSFRRNGFEKCLTKLFSFNSVSTLTFDLAICQP